MMVSAMVYILATPFKVLNMLCSLIVQCIIGHTFPDAITVWQYWNVIVML